MKSETARLKSDITLNATLATDNDAKTKEGLALLEAQVISNAKIKDGLALLEAQVISNSTATAELRKDVQGAVHGISQQVGASPTVSSDPEIQSLRSKLEEIYRKFTDRSNEVFQRAEALVGCGK